MTPPWRKLAWRRGVAVRFKKDGSVHVVSGLSVATGDDRFEVACLPHARYYREHATLVDEPVTCMACLAERPP